MGNATSFGSFNSATLATALTDETGTGAAVFAGNPTLTGTVTAAAVTLSSTLAVTGATTLAGESETSLADSGAATIGTTLGVTGATTLHSTLNVTGALTLGSASTTASNGVNISAGCFAVSGACLVGGSNYFTNSGSNTYLSTGSSLGIGNTSPFATFDVNGNIALDGANEYENFDATSSGSIGSTGYGIRDFGGVIQVKNAGGSWTPIYEGTSGGVGTSAITVSVGNGQGKSFSLQANILSADDNRNYQIQASSDGGAHWTNLYNWTDTSDGAGFLTSILTETTGSGQTPQSDNLYFNAAGTRVYSDVSGGPIFTLTAGSAQMFRLIVSSGVLASGASLQVLPYTGDGDVAEWHATDGTPARGDIVAMTDVLTSRDLPVNNPITGVPTGESYQVNTPVLTVATTTSATTILGVVSTAPGETVGQDLFNSTTSPNIAPIGITGHVPVKMTLDGGDINIGDPITISSSTPGAGMKATKSGRIIGYALEPFNENYNSQDGMIEVSIDVQDWTAPNSYAAIDATSSPADLLSGPFASASSVLQTALSAALAGIANMAQNGVRDLGSAVYATVGSFTNLFAENITADNGNFTSKICLKATDGTDVCLTGDQLRTVINGGALQPSEQEMIDGNAGLGSSTPADASTTTSSDTATTTLDSDSSTANFTTIQIASSTVEISSPSIDISAPAVDDASTTSQ